jgi:ATP-dependent DNA ligase
LPRLKRTPSPAFVEPMAAASVTELPNGDQWIYEVKWDGYRGLILKDGGRVQVRSRNNKDFALKYPGVADAACRLPPRR